VVRKKKRTADMYVMSDNCRRPAMCKNVFLNWVNSNPEYKIRKPTIAEVLCEAKKKRSPLHIILEHDVHKAARKYRYAEAQYYLRHVNVIRVEIRTKKIVGHPIRAFIGVTRGPRGTIPEESYMTARRIANNPVAKSTVITRAYNDFVAWMRRYEHYTEFMEEFNPVIDAFRQMQRHRNKDCDIVKKTA